jgi:hypothetical protein
MTCAVLKTEARATELYRQAHADFGRELAVLSAVFDDDEEGGYRGEHQPSTSTCKSPSPFTTPSVSHQTNFRIAGIENREEQAELNTEDVAAGSLCKLPSSFTTPSVSHQTNFRIAGIENREEQAGLNTEDVADGSLCKLPSS